MKPLINELIIQNCLIFLNFLRPKEKLETIETGDKKTTNKGKK